MLAPSPPVADRLQTSLGATEQSRLYKIDWNFSAGDPCRQLVIEIDRTSGPASAFVANGFIPSVNNYKWSSVYWGKRRIVRSLQGEIFDFPFSDFSSSFAA